MFYSKFLFNFVNIAIIYSSLSRGFQQWNPLEREVCLLVPNVIESRHLRKRIQRLAGSIILIEPERFRFPSGADLEAFYRVASGDRRAFGKYL
jgi:hypothetical protein